MTAILAEVGTMGIFVLAVIAVGAMLLAVLFGFGGYNEDHEFFGYRQSL